MPKTKDAKTGKTDGKQDGGAAGAKKTGDDEKSTFYAAKPVMPADKVDAAPMPQVRPCGVLP
mgnify:CR=1 FL=1